MNTVPLPIPRRSPLAATLAGALILAVGMGFGRFAFTGMYPLMVRHGELSLRAGSLAASANYVGYLIGALLLSLAKPEQSARLCRYALAGTVLCLAMLAWDGGTGFVLALRLLAGTLSAVTMIGASVWLFHVVNHPRGAPLLFAGVGVGIALSAELIALGNWLGASPSALWLALAGAGAILAALAWSELKPCPSATAVAPAETSHEPDTKDMLRPGPLVLIYGLAGFGYIVTATYLPLFVKNALGPVDPVHVWAAFGVAAVPSCFVWHELRVRLGTRRAMALNLAVQTVGVVLPAIAQDAWAFLASAVLVGATFVGTVTIAMSAGKQVARHVRFNMLATMTAAYGVGQIAGPLASDALFACGLSFHAPLFAAAAALLLAALACSVGRLR